MFVAVEGNIAFVNRAAMSMLGADEDEVLGKPFIRFVHADSRGIAARRLAHVRDTGPPNPAEIGI
ncbi:MAG: PAS domain-containing protein, partial [Planctomycetota bacterium]